MCMYKCASHQFLCSDVLTARSKLIDETDILRQQNTELRMLLHQYVNSKVCIQPELSTFLGFPLIPLLYLLN